MDNLTKLLSGLSHLRLEGMIINKQANASGFGGSSDVYAAWSLKHDKKVAVKQIRTFMKKDEAFAKRLTREIGIWATLDHPNVLPLLGFVVEGEYLTPNLISEWMIRGTLHDNIKTLPRCCEETCIMLYGIASGLSYLHSRGIIHADLKSQNVLISAKGEPMLADFGLSLVLSQSQSALVTTASCARGTVRWMAKELFVSSPDGKTPKHTIMTDIWAFGMIIYEMLSGKIPYSDKGPEHMVMLSIMRGDLPQKPDQCGDLQTFQNLWALCNSCWSDVPLRFTGYQILVYLGAMKGTPSCVLTDPVTAGEMDKPQEIEETRYSLKIDTRNLPPQIPSGGVPNLSFLESNSLEPTNVYVNSVISELFSWPWSSSLADKDQHLDEF